RPQIGLMAETTAAPAPGPAAQLRPVVVEGKTYERVAVRTRMVKFGEDLGELVKEYAAPLAQPGDWIALSEKVVSVCQNNVRHISTVKPHWLARLIVKGVKKYPEDIAWEHPAKMQAAIDMAGYPRMLTALVVGGITRVIGIHGVFWRIAGRVSEIDGFNPRAMWPYNEYAILPPRDPNGVGQRIEDQQGIPTSIIDGNNIDVKIISLSQKLPVDARLARLILLDNPMGQDEELTPIILVRAATAAAT
ncbi:MAG: coenzyme F420-0:L-glutamate ligase, partial [Chloroflexota bacterium]